MKLLAIDSSTEYASVALKTEAGVISAAQAAQKQHALVLLPMIEKLLNEANIALNQLDGIVYGRGPGSFTGLRLACSIAKGLAYAHDLPLYPVSSLAVIAQQARKDYSLADYAILALIDARMNQLYWACFDDNNDANEQVTFSKDITVHGRKKIVLAGVGYHAYREDLAGVVTSRVAAEMIIYPSAQTMIELVVAGQIKSVSAAHASPVYIRNQIVQGGAVG